MTFLVENAALTETSPPLADLRRLKSQAQTGDRRRQLQREQKSTAAKVETDAEPEPEDRKKPKRKKRNFFKWLFQTDVPTNRKVTPPPPPKVRVKIPIVYRNGEHKGVVVGGLRVPFSRPMQANRRSLLLHQEEIKCCIPEDFDISYEFPDRLSSEDYEAEHQRKMEVKKRMKEEKLAGELAK